MTWTVCVFHFFVCFKSMSKCVIVVVLVVWYDMLDLQLIFSIMNFDNLQYFNRIASIGALPYFKKWKSL